MIPRVWLGYALLAAAPAWAGEHNPTGAPESWPMPTMGDAVFGMVAVDRLEYGTGNQGESRLWDLQAWLGGDYRKLWVETEGEGPVGGSLEVAELQLLYDRTISPFWSLQVGARHDLRPGEADVSYVSLGVQGLAPQWLETDVSLFVSEDGDPSVRGELEYDLLLTQRLVLQPRLELTVNGADAPAVGAGSGLASTEAGIRLRYEVRRELAPYIGVRWERLYGDTRELARDEGERVSSTWFVVGVRAWF